MSDESKMSSGLNSLFSFTSPAVKRLLGGLLLLLGAPIALARLSITSSRRGLWPTLAVVVVEKIIELKVSTISWPIFCVSTASFDEA